MDAVEQRHCLFRLVRLQLADEVEPQTGMGIPQAGPFAFSLLHAVFAEVPLAGFDQGLDRIHRLSFRNSDQCDFGRIAPRETRGPGNPVSDLGKALGS
jgi:hypothetical protein